MPFPIATTQGGMSQAFTDVCLTPSPPAPPVPLPYPSVAQLVQGNPGTCSQKVKILNQLVITNKTVITMTNGNQPGSVGGAVSGMVMGQAKFKKVSAKVKVEGGGVGYHTCPVGHNGANANAVGVHCQPSQTKVFVNA